MCVGLGGGGGWWIIRISIDGDYRTIFLVRKFGKYLFGCVYLSR